MFNIENLIPEASDGFYVNSVSFFKFKQVSYL